ncbi:MAG: phosphoribosylformylglycinamidine synthase subunit PurL [Candidatus Latescibacteria bacterium]|nr:phosphoribosylformylglycinamidine synthase subunit PurL [Candidatus Latescibacterota bacterium]NIM22076.1 phosphoribosylformylglycinamidine synthase subunit PurL [Candidatus Latescibacterota bacterium]NIM66095.1 phosphoribosylformylglycinamidine synthase subunit PurL [Candidatus Latescibacterota bacterium]NIO02503.1 phosphoribosylformylglycinamidine synthase subunit PurL [Candidatus Latescibacterota bacterium]NIO29414.1 phosphoribosylformylglycinamidine synthase subunit PurL [Candidatus Late
MDTIQKEYLIALDSVSKAVLDRFLKEQNLSLKPDELDQLRELLGRNPSLVELHIFNTMWSEHCSYKSSRAVLKKYLPTKAPHVVLGPGEDAGVIRFFEREGRKYCLVMAHESHNHPSQVLPVEGAATGIGGIVRDVYCMGADVIGVMDPLRFGDPEGPKGARVRDIAWGVVDGIAQYANALGVPNLGGEAAFDSSFDDNCLVNVVALGIVEEADIIRSRAPDSACRDPHDVILIGKPTDASGFGGAAFASERLSENDAVERQEAVQVPDPFLKRVLSEATKSLLDLAKHERIKIGFKDLGAGGISCAVSEMAAAGGVGAFVDFDKVNCAIDNMRAEVIACSETQERYAMIVPTGFSADVLRIYNEDFELPGLYRGAGAFVIGRITKDKRFKISHNGRLVCDADVDAITTGIQYDRAAARKKPAPRGVPKDPEPGIREALLALLASYNISDKSKIYKHYDTEVQGRAVLRPGEADASVSLFLPGEPVGVAAACGGNSRLAAVDPYFGGVWAVIEAARNVACVGGQPLAITDCLNYGDPEDPGVFWEFSEGVRGIGDACRELAISEDKGVPLPVISGNVSFYNQSEKGEPIAPSPIVACAGRVGDVSVCRGMGFKENDSVIVLLGDFHASIGGSEYEALFGIAGESLPPAPDYDMERALHGALVEGIQRMLVLSAHDISHGGLVVTVSEMMQGSDPFTVGCVLSLESGFPGDAPEAHYLFSEYGGVVVEVPGRCWEEYRRVLERHGSTWFEIGQTNRSGGIEVRLPEGKIVLSADEMIRASKGKCERLFG